MITKYRSTKMDYLSQKFGESKACIKTDAAGNVRVPTQVVTKPGIICPIGYKDLYKHYGMVGHNGNDWALPMFSKIFFGWDWEGWARYDDDEAGGVGIDIVSKTELLTCNDGCPAGTKHYIKARDWHLSSRAVPEGAEVEQGDLFAYSGNSGLSSGPHLHESLKWCDKEGRGIHKDNGYYGAIFESKHPEITIYNDISVSYLINVHIPTQLSIIQVLREFVFILQQQIKQQIINIKK